MSYTKQSPETKILALAAISVLLLAMPLSEAHANSRTGPIAVSAGQLSPQETGGSDPEANLPALFAVYIITWAGFFAFVFVMSRRQREMRREIDALKTALEDRGGPASDE